jgi:hypothetical protein
MRYTYIHNMIFKKNDRDFHVKALPVVPYLWSYFRRSLCRELLTIVAKCDCLLAFIMNITLMSNK